ncbi:tRNA glutamyl-Q(34) synthetase GluQRS [Rhodoferax sp.]|uniref:tRNA glutamyl-Q(34) synthetase GluQRS n=1 Tax=Rhodoferax sp. TaxID=50421 RepID=UPI002635229D|nr:tRNA glutamyl-Q(34) synthetase GluQRS [Rhodoferax sp.]MDD2926156.1 tRNA glutamyl-Q(34) synthetase GluQRS [Rhodoferax sp.]
MEASRYIGRFAPSPTGPLHAGSLVAALASWLDARAHGGLWLVRIEDVDSTRCLPGLDQIILQQLASCGLHSDRPPLYQSARHASYQQALDQLVAGGLAYPCACTRKDIAAALAQSGQAKPRHGELVYPGTCRAGLHGKTPRAWRFQTRFDQENRPLARINKALLAITLIANINPTGTQAPPPGGVVRWCDRRLGPQQQDVASEVGDFVLLRADGCFAYQLAVVVDDGAQGITDIVRGEDLADNTARQILLQQALGLPTPRYLHTPLVRDARGEKLSKQSGAQALDTRDPLTALNQAAAVLGLPAATGTPADALLAWVASWRARWATQPNAGG